MNLTNKIMPIITKIPLDLQNFKSLAYFKQLQENIERCKNMNGLIVPCPLLFGAKCLQYMKSDIKQEGDKVCANCKLFGTQEEEIACQSKKHQIKLFYNSIRKILQ